MWDYVQDKKDQNLTEDSSCVHVMVDKTVFSFV